MLALDPPHQNSPRAGGAPESNDGARRGGRGLKVLAIGLAIVLAVFFLFVRHMKSQAETELADATDAQVSAPPVVDVAQVSPAPATWALTLPGETAAWYDSKIYARVNGYVDKWFVDIGDHVTKGQTLATIETPELDADLVAAQAKLAASVAQVKVRQADDDFAQSTDARWRNSPAGSVSQQERESKHAAFAAAAAQLIAAQAQVEVDKAQVARLTTLTQFKEVRSPFSGTVVQRDIDIGDLVTAGSTASTSSLYRVSLDKPIRIFIDAPQSAAAQLLKPGVEAVISTAGMQSRSYTGKVARSAMSIDPQARTLRVEVDIPNTDETLVPGMYVQATFKLKSVAVAQVPAAGLTYRAKGPQAAVIGEDGIVRFRDVRIGTDDGSVVEIASGLKPGEKIALNLSSQIAEGEKVRTTEPGAEAPVSVSAAK